MLEDVSDEVYRYMSFDKIESFTKVADTVEV